MLVGLFGKCGCGWSFSLSGVPCWCGPVTGYHRKQHPYSQELAVVEKGEVGAGHNENKTRGASRLECSSYVAVQSGVSWSHRHKQDRDRFRDFFLLSEHLGSFALGPLTRGEWNIPCVDNDTHACHEQDSKRRGYATGW